MTDTPLMVEQVDAICDEAARLATESGTGNLIWQAAYHAVMLSRLQGRPDPATKLADITQDVAPDLARAVERLERFCASQHEPPGYKETGPGIYFADVRAVLAALPKVDGGDVERVAAALRAYFVEHTGFATVDHDGCVSAYYGRSWIALSPTAIAHAALASLPNQGGQVDRLAHELRERSRFPSGQPRISPEKANEIAAVSVGALTAEILRERAQIVAWLTGAGGKIPGLTAFAAVVSGNNMPAMSGDNRDRLHPLQRKQFDSAMQHIADAIERGEHRTAQGGEG